MSSAVRFGVSVKDLPFGLTFSDQADNGGYGNPQPTNTRGAAHLIRIYGDSGEWQSLCLRDAIKREEALRRALHIAHETGRGDLRALRPSQPRRQATVQDLRGREAWNPGVAPHQITCFDGRRPKGANPRACLGEA